MDTYTIMTLLIAIAVIVALILVLKYYRIEVPEMPDSISEAADNVKQMFSTESEPEPEEA